MAKTKKSLMFGHGSKSQWFILISVCFVFEFACPVFEFAFDVKEIHLIHFRFSHSFFNSKKDIIFTGVEFPDLGKDYIFDGEYITKDIDDNDIKLFMIFDVYYENFNSIKSLVHKLPFHSTENSETFQMLLNIRNMVY